MSLFDLKSLVSTEDFADAHEPLNDGVKAVPNAQTVAASVKTGDVGKDTTSQGPAKVVPEKPDTDDETKTEHNVVKESAEKSGGSVPAASKAPAPKESGSGDESPAKPTESKKPDEEAEEKSEPLEHQTEKSAKDELEKTEKAKEALEAYAPKAKRFDIIGHPTRQAERIGKAVGFVQRRSGNKGTVTVSAESIDNAIALSQVRIAKLEREIRVLNKCQVSMEDNESPQTPDKTQTTTTTTTTTTGQENLEEGMIINDVPTEHDAPPMDPAGAVALTEAELDPLDVPMLEIQRVTDTIQTLEAGAAAVEQYRQIFKANPKMSKQAAAVLNAGLEHIDQVCSLKVRSTGLESFLTTPRAAMEETDAVKDSSFTDRAADIGAKILKWLASLVEKAREMYDQYRTGLSSLRDKCAALAKQKFNKDGTTVLRPAPELLFMDGEFYGDWPTPDEEHLPTKLNQHYTKLTSEIKRRVGSMLRDKSPEDIALVMEAQRGDSGKFAELPGNHNIVSEAGRLKLGEGKPGTPEEHSVENSDIRPDRLMNVTVKYLDALMSLDIAKLLKASSDEVTRGLIKYRKGHGKDLDESEFQKVQQAVVDNSIKLFDVSSYFEILKYLGSICNARYKLCSQLVAKG